MEGAKIFFTSGGGESIDTAAKLSRAYWAAVGKPDKHVIVSRQFAYHGSNAYGTALGGMAALVEPTGGSSPRSSRCPGTTRRRSRRRSTASAPDNVAAFFAEPVVGAGGVLIPPDGYLEPVQEICREREVLLVADEVITGFGRPGEWFATGRSGSRRT